MIIKYNILHLNETAENAATVSLYRMRIKYTRVRVHVYSFVMDMFLRGRKKYIV